MSKDGRTIMKLARAFASVSILAAGLALVGAACISPDSFIRSDGGPSGEGGDNSGVGGGPSSTGAGGTGVGSNGAGGHTTSGAGGTTVTSAGGHTGAGGTTTGSGGAVVIGPTANYMDDFESGDVTTRWIAPQSSDSTPCGTWTVVPDSTTGTATNHVYQQGSTACTSSNPSWAAGGNTAWTDMRLQVKVKFASGASTSTKITIAVRYNDPKDAYFIEYTNDGRMKIRERTTSSTTDVVANTSKTAVAVPDGTWSTIGLSISGSTINAYVGTDPTAPAVLTGSAAGQTMGGIAIGVEDGTASFDDVLVTPP